MTKSIYNNIETFSTMNSTSAMPELLYRKSKSVNEFLTKGILNHYDTMAAPNKIHVISKSMTAL